MIKNQNHSDFRGDFSEIYRRDKLNQKVGYDIEFCQDNLVKSKKYFERSSFSKNPILSQNLTVISGKILDVIVNINKILKIMANIFHVF